MVTLSAADFLGKLGVGFWRAGNLPFAEFCLRRSLKLRFDAPTLSSLGALLMERHVYDEGFSALSAAADRAPDHSGVLVNLANAYHRGGRSDIASDLFGQALAVDPDCRAALINSTRVSLEMCDWSFIESFVLDARVRRSCEGLAAWDRVSPFTSLFLGFHNEELNEIAKRYASVNFRRRRFPVFRKRRHSGDKIRIAYLSSDFHDHPTAHLTLGLYGAHNRACFEVYAYSIGHPDDGRHRRRIIADCDVFRQVEGWGDFSVAKQIYRDEIDILIDLKGYTGGSRPGILALRPAPIQINYLGYPGTMGASFMDYIVADQFIVPEAHFSTYSERVLWMPGTYQPTDNAQPLGVSARGREYYGLPDQSFVFCCFNNSAKIDRLSFDAWIKVLARAQGSVLWLLDAPARAKANMRGRMSSLGVDPDRLMFAEVVPKTEHLARIGLADAALDTFIYNAHTTTTDALWAGVPVVTLSGSTFASRVAGSILNACGLSQMVTQSEEEFVCVAARLAGDVCFSREVKAIARARRRSRLFDTARYAEDFDAVLREVFAASLMKQL